MKRYSLLIFIIGLFVFTISQLIPNVSIRGVTFNLQDLLLQISTTLISISALAGIYLLFGEEPTISLLKDLIAMQGAAKSLHELGVDALVASRNEFDINEMHAHIKNGQQVFIASRNFSAIKYTRVKDLFKSILSDPKKSIKIVISDASHALPLLREYHANLPASMRARFLVKIHPKVPCGLYGTEKELYVTFNLNSASGDESPALHCVKSGDKSLYNAFYREFDELWNSGKE